MGAKWKCRMIDNKKQIKWCFDFSFKTKLDDKECLKRVKFILKTMGNAGYETKDWNTDCIEYVKEFGKFSEEAYVNTD